MTLDLLEFAKQHKAPEVYRLKDAFDLAEQGGLVLAAKFYRPIRRQAAVRELSLFLSKNVSRTGWSHSRSLDMFNHTSGGRIRVVDFDHQYTFLGYRPKGIILL